MRRGVDIVRSNVGMFLCHRCRGCRWFLLMEDSLFLVFSAAMWCKLIWVERGKLRGALEIGEGELELGGANVVT